MDTYEITYLDGNIDPEKVEALNYELHDEWFVFYAYASQGQVQKIHRIRESRVLRIDLVTK